jgi:hypothetical protein
VKVLRLLTQGASGDQIAEELGPDILGQTLGKVSRELRREEVPRTRTSSSRGAVRPRLQPRADPEPKGVVREGVAFGPSAKARGVARGASGTSQD